MKGGEGKRGEGEEEGIRAGEYVFALLGVEILYKHTGGQVYDIRKMGWVSNESSKIIKILD